MSAENRTVLPGPCGPEFAKFNVAVHVVACQGAEVRFKVNGDDSSPHPPRTITAQDQTLRFDCPCGVRDWIMAEVRDCDNRLLLLGNPVYVNRNSGSTGSRPASR